MQAAPPPSPPAPPASLKRPHLVVIGGGFAGLAAVRALARAPLAITLVDRANHHLFQPLLYQVATAGLSAPDIAAPLRHILRAQDNVEVRLAEVTGIDLARRRIALDDADGQRDGGGGGDRGAGTLAYDYLLVAAGATHAYFGHDDWAGHAPGLKTLDDALTIRRRVLTAFERAEAAAAAGDGAARDAWLHFAVVGAGPTGVELAGTLAEIAQHTLEREFRHIDPRRARVRLIEAGPAVLASFPPPLQAKARAQLQRLGVEVVTGTPVAAIDGEGYHLGSGVGTQRQACRTVLWAAGVAASPLGRMLAGKVSASASAPETEPTTAGAIELDRAGRVKVLPDLSVPGHAEVFVAGDLAAVAQADGRPVPGIAPAAKQMGRHVARVLRARLAGRPAPAPFRYRDDGNLATIGRMAAVVDLRGLRLSGLVAWWFWLAAHVFFLIGFRNRLIVLVNWAWAYWTYQRHARIVHGGEANVAGGTTAPTAKQPD
ncbi:MAG: NAD(P)/FAD-dependent oxidoreductase [Rubrivivax sp.]|nr:NAD(P)/FAD-dependent oxidoreductase [Rubrivivax sp.]